MCWVDAETIRPELMDRVKRMLSFPVGEEIEMEDGDGRTVILKPANWNLNTVARLVGALEDLARFSAGADDAGMMDKILERIDPASLTPDQRKRIINGERIEEVIFSGSGLPVQGSSSGSGAGEKQPADAAA